MTDEKLKELVSEIETLELTDEEREKAPGSFIDLPCGNTHFELKGKGEPVVLVHGYATPYFIYDKIFDALVEEGYKVLRYDLLGRGLSERADVKYNVELFAKQLDELTEAIFEKEPFYLFGTSMGGSITAEFCTLHPQKVKKLILLAPAGMDTFKSPFYMKLSAIPGIGKIIFNIIGGKTLLKKCASEMKYSPESEKDYYMESFAYSIKYKDFVKCTYSSLRNTILNTKETVQGYYGIEKAGIPMLVIWGTDDRTMPYYQIDRMKEICKSAEFVSFENSGHIFLYDEYDKTLKEIIPFLKK